MKQLILSSPCKEEQHHNFIDKDKLLGNKEKLLLRKILYNLKINYSIGMVFLIKESQI